MRSRPGESRSNRRLRRLRHAIAFAFLAAWLFLVSNCETVVPRQGWNNEWGPIVPHRSFPGDCGICHLPESWDKLREDFSFDHAKQTGYPLEGVHEGASCLRCHNDRGPVSAYVARGCGGCHPDPHRDQLGLDCRRCHEPTTWRPVGLISEHARTRFPLFGAHAAVPCERCHERAPVGQFRGAPTECDLCHQRDLARATNPNHQASGWTTNCQRCHTPSSWSRASIAHDFFPLTGGHSGVDCLACHTSGNFGPIPSDCYSCHQSDFQGAPNHVASGYSHDCLQCHTTRGWDSANFNHAFFPLTGGHGGLACTQCHRSGTFGPIPSDCYSCHQSDFQGAPNHASLGFPHDCTQCHSTSSFSGSTFTHDFPLRGHHDVNCTTCHTTGSTQTFSCLTSCHSKSETDSEHQGRRGYTYDSNACYSCHPRGEGD